MADINAVSQRTPRTILALRVFGFVQIETEYKHARCFFAVYSSAFVERPTVEVDLVHAHVIEVGVCISSAGQRPDV